MTQKEYKDNQELKTLLEEKMQDRYDVTPRVVALQVEKEYKLIKKYGIARKLFDLVRLTEFAKEQELVLRCLGPINGSIIAYLLGITDANPLQYGLIFERWSLETPFHLATLEIAEGSEEILQAWVNKHTKGYTQDELLFSEMQDITIQQICLRDLKKKGVFVDFGDTFDDIPTWTLIGRGDTDDIIRLSMDYVKNYLKDVKPCNLLDFLPLVSPIAIQTDWMDDYITTKRATPQIAFCEDILEETRGYVFYQEQIMQVFHKRAGYSYARANEVRKIMSKRQMNKLETELINEFIPRCVKRGFDEEQAKKIWEDCLNVNYLLASKTYFLAMAITHYRSAYLKVHYLEEYGNAYKNSGKINFKSA